MGDIFRAIAHSPILQNIASAVLLNLTTRLERRIARSQEASHRSD